MLRIHAGTYFYSMPPIRITVLSIVVLMLNRANAQDTLEHKLSFGAFLLPSVGYRDLTINEQSLYGQQTIATRNDYEIPRFSYGIELIGSIPVSRTLAVEAGIGYTETGYRFDTSKLTFGDMIDPRRGFTYTTNARITDIIFDYRYVTLPVRLAYILGKGKVRWVTKAGVSVGYLLMRSSTLVSELSDGSRFRNTTENTTSYNRFGLFPTFSTGVGYALNAHLALGLAPFASYGVLPTADASINEDLWNAGLSAGVMWKP